MFGFGRTHRFYTFVVYTMRDLINQSKWLRKRNCFPAKVDNPLNLGTGAREKVAQWRGHCNLLRCPVATSLLRYIVASLLSLFQFLHWLPVFSVNNFTTKSNRWGAVRLGGVPERADVKAKDFRLWLSLYRWLLRGGLSAQLRTQAMLGRLYNLASQRTTAQRPWPSRLF